MANVKIIPADPHRTKSKARIEETPKLRVAAYCRVSTDTDEQATSYETQVEHYTEYISNNPKWTLAGIYADDGISGTNTKNRTEFNRMIEACMAGEIDMVISKSISRFARNTLDCLKYIRQLKAQNIPVYFEKDLRHFCKGMVFAWCLNICNDTLQKETKHYYVYANKCKSAINLCYSSLGLTGI